MQLGHTTKIADDLIRYFSASQVDDSIVAVYLFGSSIKVGIEKAADIDLAFLLDEQAYKTDPIGAMSPAHLIAAGIGRHFDKETDVTILNSASLEIAYEVVTTGKCLYELDSDTRMQYEIKIRGMYIDFCPFLDGLRSKRIAQI